MTKPPEPHIIFLATEGDSTSILFHKIHPVLPFSRIILETPESKKRFLKRRIKKLGFWEVLGQVAFMGLVNPILKLTSKSRVHEILTSFGAKTDPIPEHLITRVNSVNHPDTRKLIRELTPNLIVVNGTRIISKKVIEEAGVPLINIHAGITPMYRGVHGGYWALVQDDQENFGVTIHYIDPGVDTGNILAQKRINPRKKDNFYTYPFLQVTEGANLMLEAMKKELAHKNIVLTPSGKNSFQYYHPSIWLYLKNRIRKGIK